MCRWCALGKNAKADFPRSESMSKGILDIKHLYFFGLVSLVENEECEAPKGEKL
jgi:hypothetical protein